MSQTRFQNHDLSVLKLIVPAKWVICVKTTAVFVRTIKYIFFKARSVYLIKKIRLVQSAKLKQLDWTMRNCSKSDRQFLSGQLG